MTSKNQPIIFTGDQQLEIKQLHADGVTLRQIAERFNCSRGPVSRVLQNEIGVATKKSAKSRHGERIGLLEVVSEAPIDFEDLCPDDKARLESSSRATSKNKVDVAIWKCKCISCGSTSFEQWGKLDSLKRRISRGSSFNGCHNCSLPSTSHDLTNQKVGEWLFTKWRWANDLEEDTKTVEWYGECQLCKQTKKWITSAGIGDIKQRIKKNITEGVGCGCNTQPMKNDIAKYGLGAVTIWRNRKKEADKDNVPFEITVEDIANIPERCPVLGIPLKQVWLKGGRSDNSPSIDKFIPAKGYVKGNIHIISYRANRLKNDGTPEEWLKVAAWCQKEDVKRKLRDGSTDA
jgi:hypothetical protein